MATPADNSIKAAQILAVLQALGLYNYPTSGLAKADIKDLLESYGKNVNPKFEEIYDPISGKYAPGSAMGAALRMIDEKGSSPETVKGLLYENGIVLNADQEKDLNDYSDYVAKRNMLQAERLFNMGQTSEGMGLPSPIEGFTVPTDVVAGLFRLQDGKSISGEAKKQADVAQQAYERYLAMKEMGKTSGSFVDMMKEAEATAGGTVPQTGGILINGKRYANKEEYLKQVQAENANLVEEENKAKYDEARRRAEIEAANNDLGRINAPLPTDLGTPWDPGLTKEMVTGKTVSGATSKKIDTEREKSKPSKGFDYRSNIVRYRQRVAEIEAMKDKAVADVLRNQLQSSFGSPYEMQVIAANDRLAQIAAYEAWLKEQKALKKRRGF